MSDMNDTPLALEQPELLLPEVSEDEPCRRCGGNRGAGWEKSMLTASIKLTYPSCMHIRVYAEGHHPTPVQDAITKIERGARAHGAITYLDGQNLHFEHSPRNHYWVCDGCQQELIYMISDFYEVAEHIEQVCTRAAAIKLLERYKFDCEAAELRAISHPRKEPKRGLL